jgi:chaperonin GroEL (HSP60 family)
MNPMDLRRGMEQAIEAVVNEIQQWSALALALALALASVRWRLPTWLRSRPTTTDRLAYFWPLRSTSLAAIGQGAMPGGGVAVLPALAHIKGAHLDHGSRIRLIAQALDEPLRCITRNTGGEPSVA